MHSLDELAEMDEEEIEERSEQIEERIDDVVQALTSKEPEANDEFELDELIQVASEDAVGKFMTAEVIYEISMERRNLLYDRYPDIIETMLVYDETIFLTKLLLHQIIREIDLNRNLDDICDDLENIANKINSIIDDIEDDIEQEEDIQEIPRDGATVTELAARLEDKGNMRRRGPSPTFVSNIAGALRDHVGYFVQEYGNKQTDHIQRKLMNQRESEPTPLTYGVSNSGGTTEYGVNYQDPTILAFHCAIAIQTSMIIIQMEETYEDILRIELTLAEHIAS